mmetsp:Transcript_53750/g.60040  ORF Transcript_53750/g.60040 Transcript_53750/m.60040 type:complete len:487 (-) Transcript_53750:58-1518(-)
MNIPFHHSVTSFHMLAMFCIFAITVDSFTGIPHRRLNTLPKRTRVDVNHPYRHQRHLTLLSASSTTTNDTSYIRWVRQKSSWRMQTAVTTFRRGDQTVELHAQLHFGDKEYFQYWNSDNNFNKIFDCVLFELLVDEDLLEYKQGNWRLKGKIMASLYDKKFGQNLGLQCQASLIDYTKSKWVHADLSRQEFTDMAQNDRTREDASNDQPLWKLASLESSSTASEAVAALMVGPPSLNYSAQSPRKRKLFTNLFLPGDSFAFALRAILWMTVPAPELSIILLDWSSLLQGGSNPSALSQLALPILTSLVKFDIHQMRRFMFGQVLMSSKKSTSQRENFSSAWSLLVIKRNEHALKILRRKLEEKDVNSAALLYGSSHCPDLHNKIISMNFKPTKTIWRTAWSVQESTEFDDKQQQEVQPPIIPALGSFLIFYLLVGAFDWIGIVGDISSLLFDTNYLDTIFKVVFYLSRHVLLYLTLSKSLVDWTET